MFGIAMRERKQIEPKLTYTLATFRHLQGVYVICGAGTSAAGDIYVSIKSVQSAFDKLVAGRQTYSAWESQMATYWQVPQSKFIYPRA